MFRETIENEYIVIQEGTSEGTQMKYRKGDYWYKKDCRGKEGLVEYLVSEMLKYSTLDLAEYVVYEYGCINEARGCRSKNFLEAGEELITFYRLYYNEFGKDLSQILALMETMEERIEYVIKFVWQSCGLDITEYLKKVFTLDMLILNEDRHLNNLAVVLRGNRFVSAPIFDNGMSLLTANQSVNWHFPAEENVKRVIARPFCGSHEKMFHYFGQGFCVDFAAVQQWIEEEEDTNEKKVLKYQLQRYSFLATESI